jgi:putative flippase GtrA
VETTAAELKTGMSRARVNAGLRKRANWEQLVKFCFVGASGYAVNLFVFSFVFLVLGVHYIPGNRLWTFRDQRGHYGYQGMRFLVVSTLALGANLLVLSGLVAVGLEEVLAQAIAIVLVTPINFLGNKLWSFGPRA